MRHLQWLVVGLAIVGGCVTPRPPVETVESPVVPAPTEAPAGLPERWISVHKTARTLSVYEGDQLVRTYPVVLGKDPVWAKLYQGDHRTPEGEYHVSKKYFHPFWDRFILLDYPTSANREMYAWSREKGLLPERHDGIPGIGGAIGIHGTEDEGLNRLGINWTEGCISLFNHDIEELYDLVSVGTRVVIER